MFQVCLQPVECTRASYSAALSLSPTGYKMGQWLQFQGDYGGLMT